MTFTRSAAKSSGGMGDPLEALGPDLFQLVLAALGPHSLALSAPVSRGWRREASDGRLWERLCEEAWEGRAYVPAAQRTDLSWKQRYAFAIADASRTAITVEELCTFRWWFRFKPEAGEYWMSLDPFWSGQGPQMQRLFSKDGSVSAPPDDPLWGEHECRWRVWKTREGVRGHFVKLQINHWPSLDCSRTALGGWQMQNMWVVYEAVLLPGGTYCRGLHHGLARHLSS